MKTGHENIQLIEDWLDSNNLEVQMEDSFIRRVYDEVLEMSYSLHTIESVKKRDRCYKLQYEFVRRDLLKIIHKRNNKSAKGIKAGYVYAIGNPAWGDYVKVGSAIDVNDRLNSYQTSSPYRDYFVIDYFCTYDRLEIEKNIHSLFERNSEWCKVSREDVKILFKKLKTENQIPVLDDKLYAVKRQLESDKLAIEKLAAEKKADKKRIAQRAARHRRNQRKRTTPDNRSQHVVLANR